MTDMREPMREAARRESVEPICACARMEIMSAVRMAPVIDKDDPRRLYCLNESDEPSVTKSRMESAEPNLPLDLTDRVLPRWKNSSTETAAPIFIFPPKTESPDPIRTKSRKDTADPRFR